MANHSREESSNPACPTVGGGQADQALPIPNEKIINLAKREESLLMTLLFREEGLMQLTLDAGIREEHFISEVCRHLFSLARRHHDRYGGTILTRAALASSLAEDGLKPEQIALYNSKYDVIVGEFGASKGDFSKWIENVLGRYAQCKAWAVVQRYNQKILGAMSGHAELIAEMKREIEAIDSGLPARRQSDDEARKPWQKVTSADVSSDIRGTRLEVLVNVLASVAEPPLPLELTLPKALALVGTAMSRPKDHTWKTAFPDDEDPVCGVMPKTGPIHLRFMINTAGGQACNVWAMIVAGSGIGKDIGNVPSKLAMGRGWLIGSSGSGEGLKDAFVQVGSGLMAISELQPFLDKGSWQYGCTEFLTSAFNAGWFKEVLSRASKTGGHVRRSAFCYPSVLANIQPNVLHGSQGASMLFSSGFLQRFLVSVVERGKVWRPRSGDIDIVPALVVLEKCEEISGVAEMPQGYLQDVMDEFAAGDANESVYSRLVNEYGPRFACMLAADPVHPTADDLAKAGRMVKWFYSMSERVMLSIEEDAETRETNRLVDRILGFVRERKKAPWREFVQRFGRIPGRRREQVVRQMEDDGLVVVVHEGRGKVIRLP